MTAAEPYWSKEQWVDGVGERHERWQPSQEMQYLLGYLRQTQGDIEKVTLARPTLLLLPADKTPDEARDGGTLMGIPFVVSDEVTEISMVYPVRAYARIQMVDGTARVAFPGALPQVDEGIVPESSAVSA